MQAVFAPTVVIIRRRTWSAKPDRYPDRMKRGMQRRRSSSDSALRTTHEASLRRTRVNRHSRVYSSMMSGILDARRPSVWRCTKSYDQM